MIHSCVFSIDLPPQCQSPQLLPSTPIPVILVTSRAEKSVQWTLLIPHGNIFCEKDQTPYTKNAEAYLTCNRLPKGPPTIAIVLEETKDVFTSAL